MQQKTQNSAPNNQFSAWKFSNKNANFLHIFLIEAMPLKPVFMHEKFATKEVFKNSFQAQNISNQTTIFFLIKIRNQKLFLHKNSTTNLPFFYFLFFFSYKKKSAAKRPFFLQKSLATKIASFNYFIFYFFIAYKTSAEKGHFTT